jgi:hypothetical protein
VFLVGIYSTNRRIDIYNRYHPMARVKPAHEQKDPPRKAYNDKEAPTKCDITDYWINFGAVIKLYR